MRLRNKFSADKDELIASFFLLRELGMCLESILQVKVSCHLSWQFLPATFFKKFFKKLFSSCDFSVNSLSSLPSRESGGGLCISEEREENKSFFSIHSSSSELPRPSSLICLIGGRGGLLSYDPLLSYLYLFAKFTSYLHLLSPSSESAHFLSFPPTLPPVIAHLLTQKTRMEMR